MSEETSSVTLPTPFGPAKFNGKKTAEFIMVLLAIAVGVGGYALWEHKEASAAGFRGIEVQLEKNQMTQTENTKELANAIKDQTKAQRYQTCILSIPMPDREKEYNNPNGLCARLTR